MLNDLVYLLQNKLTTTDMLYVHVVELFDSKKYDIAHFFSELSRISAIAKFANVHDSGITSAFTDRTFELIAEHRATVESFSLCSLIESGYDDAQIQLPGFLSSFDYRSTDDKPDTSESSQIVSDQSEDDSVKLDECDLVAGDILDISKVDFIKSNFAVSDALMHSSANVNVTNDASVPTRHVEHSHVEDLIITAKAPANSSYLSAGLIDMTVYDSENPDKYDSDIEERNMMRFGNNDNNIMMSKTDKLSLLNQNEICRSENGTPYFINRTESDVKISSHYNLFHRKRNDPFRPDDYYAIPDLCYTTPDKHKNVSVYDMANYVTHLPLSQID